MYRLAAWLLWPWPFTLGWTEADLVSAVQGGNVSEVESLLESDNVDLANISYVGPYGQHGSWTLVHEAAHRGHVQILQLLVKAWPQGVEAITEGGWTPLSVAGRRGNLEAYLLLAEHAEPEKAPPNPEQMDCQLLVQLGCNETRGFPALEAAAKSLTCRNPELLTQPSLQLWLSCGGDVRWQDEAGTPLLGLLENEEARNFWQTRATVWATVVSTLGDWKAWVMPSSTALAAYLCVRAERKLVPKPRAGADPFLEGAKLWASQALRRHSLLLKLWRWMEVCVGIFWLGLVLLIVHWAWWLPLVTVFYVAPDLRLYGAKEVFRAPTLAIMTRSFGGQVAALIRTTALLAIFSFVYGGLFWRLMVSDSIVSVFSWMLHPLLRTWSERKVGLLEKSWLNEHWLFSWAPAVSALDIFNTLRDICIWLVIIYWAFLLCGVLTNSLRRAFCKGRATFLWEAAGLELEKQKAVQALLQEPPEKFCEVDKRIKPLTAFAWPWQGAGLYQEVALHSLDIALHVNTIFSFLLLHQYFFASIMTFVVVRSVVKQFCVLTPAHFRQERCLQSRMWHIPNRSGSKGFAGACACDHLQDHQSKQKNTNPWP